MDAGSRLLQNAVPFFLIVILLELYFDRRRGTLRYRRAAMWSDLAAGSVSQVFDLLLKAACLPVYVWLYERARLFDPTPTPWLHWALALVGVDFLYYFWHRAGHEVRALWAIHSVHHQSEDMNLAVALRQPAFQAPSVVLFFLPLALLGVTPGVLMFAYTANLIYQFFIHTEAVRSLGPLEWVLNTPSHHRVHHGRNPQYLDKNYGGILIVWDRLFGTFTPEREAPSYGITTPLASFNPLWANLIEFVPLLGQTRELHGGRGMIRLWLGHPALTLPSSPKAAAAPALGKYEAPSHQLAPYVYWQAVLLFVGQNSAFLFVAHAAPRSPLAITWAALAVLWSAVALLGFLEQKRWVRRGELARVPFVVIGAGLCAFLLHGALAGGLTLLLATLVVGAPLLLMPLSILPPLAAGASHERG
jgi:alkylglycerol monooxygenase